MNKRAFIIIMMAVALVTITNAQPSYRTKLHAKIAKAINLNLPDSLAACINNDSTWSFNGRPLRVRTNVFGKVTHIGYKIFDNAIVELHKSSSIFNFVERYALELDLRLDERTPADRMDLDWVVCSNGNVEMLKEVKADTPFTLEERERRMYRLKWSFNDKELSLTIPADFQLLIGANAIELEEIFKDEVKGTVPKSNDEIIAKIAMSDVSRAGKFLVAQSDMYLSELIRSDIYLTEKNGSRELLVDAKNPLQSVRNIMLTGASAKNIPMRMKLNRYGYKASMLDISLQQFIAYCLDEGCKLYFGMKERDEHVVKGTLFALNTENAYNHMLSVEFPMSVLKDGTGTIMSTAYVYIPLQNITEKFFTEGFKK